MLSREHDTRQLLKEIDRDQAPVTWPETLNGGRAIDEFLWNGDPKATRFQRAALAFFALKFVSLFVASIAVIVKNRDLASTVIGLFFGTLSGIASLRFLVNAFRRKVHQPNHHSTL